MPPPLWGFCIPCVSNWEETLRQAHICWRDNVAKLVWEHVWTPQEEVEEVAMGQDDKQQKMDGRNVWSERDIFDFRPYVLTRSHSHYVIFILQVFLQHTSCFFVFFYFLIELEILAFLHDVRYLLKVDSLEEKLSHLLLNTGNELNFVLLFIWVCRCQFESGVGGVETWKQVTGSWGEERVKEEEEVKRKRRTSMYVLVIWDLQGSSALLRESQLHWGEDSYHLPKDRWAVWGFKRFWESLQLKSKRQVKYLV